MKPAPSAAIAALFLPAALTLAGCTTMNSIEEKGPSYIVDFSGVDRVALSDCVAARSEKKWSYDLVKAQTEDYASIQYFLEAFLPATGGPLVSAGGVPYFAVRIYDDRAEIFGRFSVWGDHGKDAIPVIKDCVAVLGGTSSERARPKKS